MRVKKGIISKISNHANISTSALTNYINRWSYPSRSRAIHLEKASKRAGFQVSKEIWIFGTKEEIKNLLSNSSHL